MEDYVKVKDLIGTEWCVSVDDGEKLFTTIKSSLSLKQHVTVSFSDVSLITPCFMNMAIGRLYGEFHDELITRFLKISDLTDKDIKLLQIQIKRAKRFFSNPAYYNKLYQKMFDEEIY